MSRFAVIETGGKQYKVSAGQKIKVEKLNTAPGGKFSFDKVLLVAEGRGNGPRGSASSQRESAIDVRIGTPYIDGAKVEAEIVRQARDKKKIVFRYHSKTRYRKKKGHRQHFTEAKITRI